MKFTKFGKTLLMGALSCGLMLGITSCVQSYTVGYLYVTGTVTAQSGNNGIISGFKIDHNTGRLIPINGLPIASGGSNPIRAVLITGSRFMYILNRGVNSKGNANCTTADPCQNANITEFSVGGNGILSPQQTYFTQGINPFRMIVDSSGNYLLVLDHDAPSNATCKLALGSSATSCGDITVFKIDQTTGRLVTVVNAQVSTSSGQQLTYFPVPANPIDFTMTAGNVLTMSGTPATGDSVFPYTYAASSGQLTLNQNTSQPLGIFQGTNIVNPSPSSTNSGGSGGGVLYVLDNEAPNPNPTGTTSQILPFTVGSNGSLQAEPTGVAANDPTVSNPTQVLVESKGKYVYVLNQGNNLLGPNAQSGITGYFITTSPSYQLNFTTPSTFGTGGSPQCIVEDPSDQYIYTANYNDSSVTGRLVDPNAGVLNNLRVQSSYSLNGPPTWCIVDGRTN